MSFPRRHFFPLAFWTVLSLVLGAGCANYHMGDTANLPFKSVYVAPIENASVAPQAQAPISTQIRTALTNAGLSLEPRGVADAVLTVTITEYYRTGATTQSTDTMVASAYDLTIVVKATLKSTDNTKTYFKDLEISTTLQIQQNSGYVQAEYQIMPLLAREVGRKVKDAVTTVW